MKSVKLLFTIIALLGIVMPVLTDDNKSISAEFEQKRKELWQGFHKASFEKFGKMPKINIYAENDSLTKICFICNKELFVYNHKDSNKKGISHIETVVHAKLLMYDTINRITYEKESNIGCFNLWYYETKELSIGADN